MPNALELRILISMPSPADGDRTARILAEHGLLGVVCATVEALSAEMKGGVGAVLLTDEILAVDADKGLSVALRSQPPWSALPVVLLARDGRAIPGGLGSYDHVIVVERPARVRSLVSAVQSALRTRKNQYSIRQALTEREEHAAELIAQDEKLRFTLAAGQLGSWELDLPHRHFECSDMCKANHGRSTEEAFGYAEFMASIREEDRARLVEAIELAALGKAPLDLEYRVAWPDGSVHWLMMRGRGIHTEQGRRVAGVSIDVTERKRLHEQLLQSQVELAQQAEQLRTADRLKDEFLATLAHELRNPLAPIRTGLSLLDDASDPETTRRTVGIMQRQVRHIVRLIDDLLDVSRITLGKLELKREPLALAGVLDAAVEANLPAIQRAQQTLNVHGANSELFLSADATRLAQVISNLLNNASKYTQTGGVIDLSVTQHGGNVSIAVSDNGSGIPANRLDDLFEMFTQGDHAIDRTQGGLGIGLALVRKLIVMHGGTVEARSAGLGRGSTFTISLPIIPRPPVEVAPERRTMLDASGQQILVVDDNEDAAQLIALMLQKAGYKTTTAADGPEAIRTATTLSPDIVILDIGLPGMSGYQVAEKLRANERLSGITLIALTGWGSHEDKRRALAAGFDDHLTKPVAAEQLREVLARARPKGGTPSDLAQPSG